MSIRLDGIQKRFASFAAVEQVDFEIEDGEFFVLLGPSGCGKTTTLRMIAGLEHPTSGRIYINDQEVTGLEPRHRDIAMAFQDFGLYPHLSGYDNIAFPLRIKRARKDEIERRVRETANKVNVAHLLQKKPGQMSGGERQRISLARALVRNPRVFLMDEPLSNLDAKLRVSMRTEIKKLVTQLGITTVYVTHDQVEAMAMADRIAVMNRGRVEQIGAPLEVYDRPATKFVAQFIGSPPMNLFEATLGPDGSLHHGLGQDANWMQVRSLLDGGAIKINPNESVTVGVRPENILLKDGTQAGIPVAAVDLVEALGQDTYVYLKIGEVPLVAVTHRTNLKAGDKVGVDVARGALRVVASAAR